MPHPGRPSSAEPRLRQDFEGHGVEAPQPFNRGFVRLPPRPTTAATERPSSAADDGKRGRRRRDPKPAFMVHVHVRDKVLSVNVGDGGQAMYWLGRAYRDGRGVERDLLEAKRWFQLALDAGPCYTVNSIAAIHCVKKIDEELAALAAA